MRVDHQGAAAGRGAYVCAAVECVEKALQAGRLGARVQAAEPAAAESAVAILASWKGR